MSSTVLVRFCNKDFIVKEIEFDLFKNVLQQTFVDLDKYYTESILDKANKDYSEEFFGLIQKDINIQEADVEYSKEENGEMIVKFVSGAEDKYQDLIVDLPTEEILKGDYKKDYFTTLYDKVTEIRGKWYSELTLNTIAEELQKISRQLIIKVTKLEAVKDSEKFYMLNEEQRFDLSDDIRCANEDIQDIEYAIRACTSLADMMEAFKDSCEPIKAFIAVV